MLLIEGTNLQEHLPEHAIGLFPEGGGEDHGNTVRGRLDVDDLLVAVVQRHKLSLAGAPCLQLLLRLEACLKRRGQRIPLE